MIARLFRSLVRDAGRLFQFWRMRRDPVGYARSLGVKVGANCQFFSLRPGTFGSEPYLVTLGNNVYVTGGVQFITHDGGALVFRGQDPTLDVIAPIVIGDNVFLGLNAIVLPGVTIGSDCVIGAGSVVTRDVPPGTVAAGVPARRICSLAEYREKLKAKSLPTARLSPAEKRKFLEQRFYGRPDGGPPPGVS